MRLVNCTSCRTCHSQTSVPVPVPVHVPDPVPDPVPVRLSVCVSVPVRVTQNTGAQKMDLCRLTCVFKYAMDDISIDDHALRMSMKYHTIQIRQIFYSFARSLTTLRNSTASFVTMKLARPPPTSLPPTETSTSISLAITSTAFAEK